MIRLTKEELPPVHVKLGFATETTDACRSTVWRMINGGCQGATTFGGSLRGEDLRVLPLVPQRGRGEYSEAMSKHVVRRCLGARRHLLHLPLLRGGLSVNYVVLY